MKTILLCIGLLCGVTSAHACFNVYYTADRDGHLHEQGDDHAIMIGFNTNFNKRMLEGKIQKLYATMRSAPTYRLLSDYALMLMKLGKKEEAFEIFRALYDAHPNEYQLAANLGTAYELMGQPDSALKYIQRGLELNPVSHANSEWVHVRVLETKLKLKNDPDYLQKNTVLNLTPAQEKDTVIGDQIELQVRERFPFCPGPDMIMASLMTDLGDITMNTESIEDAKTYYNIAKFYFGDSSATVNKKLEEVRVLLGKYAEVRPDRKVPGHPEIMNQRLGPYSYTQMLDDNDPDHYNVNWPEINTDVDSLLGMIGLKRSSKVEPIDTMLLVNDIITAPEETAKSTASNGAFWLCSAVLLILGGGYAFMIRMKE